MIAKIIENGELRIENATTDWKNILNKSLNHEHTKTRSCIYKAVPNPELKHVVIDAGDLLHVRTQNSELD